MIRNNIVRANNWRGDNCQTAPVWQWDYGQILKIEGVALPVAYEVHFTTSDNRPAIVQIGNADGVNVPDQLLDTGRTIIAYIYLHTGDADGETVKIITIPVSQRAAISNEQPTPEQQTAIEEAITTLNQAVEDCDEIVLVQDEQPTAQNNKIWIQETPAPGIQVPTYAEHEAVANAMLAKVSKPTSSPNGVQGQLLQTNGDGTTQWVDSGTPSDAQVDAAVEAWLSEHPVSALDASTASRGQVPTADGDGDWAWTDSNSQDATRIDVYKFGGYDDGTHAAETEQALNDALAWAKGNGYSKAYLPAGTYLIRGYDPNASSNIGVNAGIVPPSDMHLVLAPDAIIKIEPNSKTEYNAFYLENKDNVTIEGGKIIGDRPDHNYSLIESTHEWGTGLRARGCLNFVMRNVEMYDFTGDCISIGNTGFYGSEDYIPTTNARFLNCNLHRARRNGISISGTENTLVWGCNIHEIGITIDGIAGTQPRTGIDIEGYGEGQTILSIPLKITISNCYFNGNKSDLNMFTGDRVVVTGNHFETNVEFSYSYDGLVAGNVFHGNGTGTAVSFTSSRQSKSYESICKLSGNIINNFEAGVNVRGAYVSIENNLIMHCSSIGIITYSQGSKSKYLNVANNMVAKCGNGIRIFGCINSVIDHNVIMSVSKPFSWYAGGGDEIVISNNIVDTFTDRLLQLDYSTGALNKVSFVNNIIKNGTFPYSTGIVLVSESFGADIVGNHFCNITAPYVIQIANESNYPLEGGINIERNVFKNCTGKAIYSNGNHTPVIRILKNTVYVKTGAAPVFDINSNVNRNCSLIAENMLLPEDENTAITVGIKTAYNGVGTIIRNILMVGTIDAVSTDTLVDNYVANA